MRRQAGHRASFQFHCAAVRGEVAGDQVEQRGLAGTVRPGECCDHALLQIEIDIVDRDDAAEMLAQSANLEKGRFHCRRPAARPTNPAGRKIISSTITNP